MPTPTTTDRGHPQPGSSTCPHCMRWLPPLVRRCRRRKCPGYSPLWAGDQRRKLFVNLTAYAHQVSGAIRLPACSSPQSLPRASKEGCTGTRGTASTSTAQALREAPRLSSEALGRLVVEPHRPSAMAPPPRRRLSVLRARGPKALAVGQGVGFRSVGCSTFTQCLPTQRPESEPRPTATPHTSTGFWHKCGAAAIAGARCEVRV